MKLIYSIMNRISVYEKFSCLLKRNSNTIRRFLSVLIFIFSFIKFNYINAQGFYAIDTIQKIEIQFFQSNWDYILDTSKQGSDGYLISKWVKINGIQFDSAGVKYKGNSSYNVNNMKNPFHIELDYVKNQNYQGYNDIKLSNGFKDPSFVREVLAYKILKKYMASSLSNYAQLYINGQLIGLYSNSEAVTKSFADKYFYSKTNPFFYMDNFGGNLAYLGTDNSLYYSKYTLKSSFGWANLVNLCNTLQNNVGNIESILDVDRTLWMLAFDNILVNLDSYIGQPMHNYYIYEDDNGRFNPIVWDVNEAFGNFTNSGSGNLNISQEQTMSPWLHLNDVPWPLINKLFTNPMFKRMYIAHAKTIVNENFTNNDYFTTAQYLQTIVDAAVQSDIYKFYTYQQFLDNITNNVTSGPQTIVGISNLMTERTTYLNSTTDFQQIAPTISNIQPSDTLPFVNSNIYITANTTNATNVFLGTRNSILEKFTRMIMFDDGAHNDGAAGDGVYGISLTITSPETQYYIYAENNNAGIFSPERAEHEYYTIHTNYNVIPYQQLVINEIMAVNNTTVQNNNGLFSDWIEFYNNSSDTLLLDYLYLSDNFLNPLKWQFPTGVSILPNQYLIVWADNDTVNSQSELHSNFKLSGTGEQVILSYPNGVIIDSTTFYTQSTDITWGRYPNGVGSFGTMLPTIGATNSPFSVNEIKFSPEITIFPNPADEFLNISFNNNHNSNYKIKIYSITGNLVLSDDFNIFSFENFSKKYNVSNINKGMYFVKIETVNDIIIKKIIFE